MGCKQSRLKRPGAVGDSSGRPQKAVLEGEGGFVGDQQCTRDELIWNWLEGNNYGAAAGGDDVSNKDDMGSLELAEEFTIDQPLEQDKELPKTPKKVHFADNLIATPTPFRPGPVSPLGRERDCQQPSEEKSTFIFNHVPVAVPVPYENPPRKGCGDLAKVDNKKDLKKRKVKQQRREADQIRRKRKKAAAVGTHVVAFADDDTLADLASTLNMPVINYSVVLSL